MGEGAPEVRVRLVFDSNAESLAEDIRNSLKHLEEDSKKHGKGMGEKLGEGVHEGLSTSSVFKGEVLKEAFMKMAEYGKEALMKPFESFEESEKQVREMTNQLTLLSSKELQFNQTHALATQLKEELELVAMAAGEADDALVQTFENIMQRGNQSVETAEKLTISMAYAGRAVKGGMEGLSQAFSMLEMGMVRPRNPLVQMIASTHVLKGNAKQVAHAMQAMTPEKQIELATKAVEKMGKKMKEQPMTLDQINKSMAVFKDSLLKNVGKGIFEKFEHFRAQGRGKFFEDDGQMTDLGETLTSVSKKVGEKLGDAFELGMDFVAGFKEGVGLVSNEAGIIWHEVFGKGDSSFETWKTSVHTIAGVFGLIVTSFAAGIGAIIVALEKTAKFIMQVNTRVWEEIATSTGSKSAGSAALASRAIAYGSDRKSLLYEASSVGGRKGTAIQEEYNKTTDGSIEQKRQAYEALHAADEERMRREAIINDAKIQAMTGQTQNYAAAFAEATTVNDKAMQEHIAHFVIGNQAIQASLMNEGPAIFGKGVDAFIDALREAGGKDFAEKFKSAKNLDKTGITNNQTFTGGITVKQDFKDQDPDRVAVAFVDKLAEVGISRGLARTSTPFGF